MGNYSGHLFSSFLEDGIDRNSGEFCRQLLLFHVRVCSGADARDRIFSIQDLLGLEFRASSLDGDRTMAQSCGVNQNIVTIITFAISGMLASLAGGLYAPIAGASYGIEGNALLLAALTIIIGGVGSIAGAVLTAFIIGIARVVTAVEVPILELAIPFIIASITLMIRPFGIWGREFKH